MAGEVEVVHGDLAHDRRLAIYIIKGTSTDPAVTQCPTNVSDSRPYQLH